MRLNRSRPPPRWVWPAVAVAIVAASGWKLADRHFTAKRTKIADAAAWRIQGPPCPPMTEAEFFGGRRAGPRGFDYEGVTFSRRHGPVKCATIYEDGGRGEKSFAVCQFARPEELRVRTGQGDWYFKPGPGQPATISLAGGVAHCVMAARIGGTRAVEP